MTEYIYKNNVVKLFNFLNENGEDFVLTNYGEDTHIIEEKTKTNLYELFLSKRNKPVFISNINTNVFLSINEYFIPFRKAIPAEHNEVIGKKLYYIDFVKFNYKNESLQIIREETGSISTVRFQSKKECMDKTNLKSLESHVILRNHKDSSIFIPVYDVKNKIFYDEGVRCLSPYNFVE